MTAPLRLASLLCTGLLLVLSGCDEDPSPRVDAGVDADLDAGTDGGGGETPDCSFTVDPSVLRGRQGGQLAVPFEIGAGVSSVGLATAQSVADRVDFDQRLLRLRLPYGASTAVWTVRSVCAGEPTLHTLSFSVEPLPWTRAVSWMENVDGPQAREYFSLFIDEAAPDRLLLYGGFVYRPMQFTPNHELWELSLADGGGWTLLSPEGEVPAVTGGRLALDPGTRTALYLGGFDASFGTPYRLHRLAYAEGDEAWSDEVPHATSGLGDYQPGLIHDPVRDRFLSFCGSRAGTGYHCEVRQLSGGAWSSVAVEPGPAPVGRNGHAFAYDAVNDRVIVFGGDRNGTTLGDTWALELSGDRPRWVELSAESAVAVRRRNAAFALDPLNHRLLVWGGTTTGATAVPGLVALDLTLGEEAWHEVQTTGTPPSRASGGAVFDAARGRMLMGFGNSEAGLYADLWALGL